MNRFDNSSEGSAKSFFFFSSRRRHTRFDCDWSSDVCSSDLLYVTLRPAGRTLALLAASLRLVYASMWVLMSLNQLTALRLLNGADYLRVLEIGRASCRERV